jgi:hypothetical protein
MSTKKFLIVFLAYLGMSMIAPVQYVLSKTGELYVGIAKIDITPPIGIKMRGHAAREKPSQGIHDPLYVKVLVLESGGAKAAIITCDLGGYPNKRVLEIAKGRYHMPYTMICSSHTHSGPDLRDSEEYAKAVEKAMSDGIGKALGNMFPAKIVARYKSFPQLSYNRITGKGEGIALWRNYERIPYGPVDPEVGVIKIEDETGNPRVILMQYACHPVVNGHNLEISADYPGIAMKKVEEAFGDNTTCMFILGGAGDINPLFMTQRRDKVDDDPTTDYTQIEKMGTLLADQVIETAKSLSPADNKEASLKVMSDSLSFTGRFKKEREFDIRIITMLINDDIAIAASSGEYFVKHQAFWKENVKEPNPFFFGYSYSGGTNPGYVPDIRSTAIGGYGIDFSSHVIEIGAGEAIMNKHLENLYRMKGMIGEKPVR